jgi:hypothetical protein
MVSSAIVESERLTTENSIETRQTTMSAEKMSMNSKSIQSEIPNGTRAPGFAASKAVRSLSSQTRIPWLLGPEASKEI